MRLPVLVPIFAALALAGPQLRAQDGPQHAAPPIVREITVPLHDGRVDVAELVGTLLSAYDFDADAVDLPSKSIDLRGVRGQLVLLGCRKLLLETVRFRRSLDDDVLTLIVDRERAREVRRQLRARVAQLAGRVLGEDLLERRYELALPASLDPDRPLVVLIHGVEGSPEIFADLRSFLAPLQFQVATFAYPNDDSCDRSAAELSKALRARGRQRIRIVAHSMGGLIARAAIEDPALDPGNVETLILTGVPNGGSSIAGLRFALEAAHLLRRPGDDHVFALALLEGLRANLLDGLGEAGGDLLPGSVFLTLLAERERNPHVHYHLVLGTRSLLTEEQLDAVRARIDALLDRSRATRIARPKIEVWLQGLSELVDGEGDGAVAVTRGALADVDPVCLPLDHLGLIRRRGLLGRIQDGDEHPVFIRIKEWLAGRSPL